MKRREFITLLGGAATWPIAARAQQPAVPVVGVLSSVAADAFAPFMAAFRQGLTEAGYVEGRNVAIEYRWAEGQYDHLPDMAADLIERRVTLIFAMGGPIPAMTAKQQTSTVPIVFAMGSDPVGFGLVASLNRPGGNVTGVTFQTVSLDVKRLELLHELIPKPVVIGVLINPNSPNADPDLKELLAASDSLGRRLEVLRAGSDKEIDDAFAMLTGRNIAALLVSADAFLFSRTKQVIALADHYRVPVVYELRESAALGGLMTYGASLTDAYRISGNYVGRILKGEKPADLPVQQVSKIELVINLKTARVQGFSVPESLLARADEVIE
jgi:putative tryptophan/tyrosine transport system substrate-binding protein